MLLVDVTADGIGRLSWDFINSFPSRKPEQAGIKAALFGTLWLMGLTAAFAVPIGIGAAIYLEEYASRNWLNRIIQTNIANLAGVPSIVYGILGLAIFVRTMSLGRSVLAGSLTMALLVLPIVIIASQEALRAVPKSLREAAYGVGASRWQVVFHQVLPAAMPGILTGDHPRPVAGHRRGRAAHHDRRSGIRPLRSPSGPMDRFTVLPIQIFNWASRPQAAFGKDAAAGYHRFAGRPAEHERDRDRPAQSLPVSVEEVTW